MVYAYVYVYGHGYVQAWRFGNTGLDVLQREWFGWCGKTGQLEQLMVDFGIMME
jgi:hypothetical protein